MVIHNIMFATKWHLERLQIDEIQEVPKIKFRKFCSHVYFELSKHSRKSLISKAIQLAIIQAITALEKFNLSK